MEHTDKLIVEKEKYFNSICEQLKVDLLEKYKLLIKTKAPLGDKITVSFEITL